jgi:hypothetical protein
MGSLGRDRPHQLDVQVDRLVVGVPELVAAIAEPLDVELVTPLPKTRNAR